MTKKELYSMILDIRGELDRLNEEIVDLKGIAAPKSVSTDSESSSGLKLCYVDEHEAWFTECSLKQQWGDDWNDAPYEHNAGDPYNDHYEGEGMDKKRVEHRLLKVFWVADEYKAPCEGTINSQWSVEAINSGAVAWLSARYPKHLEANLKPIHAGTSLTDFITAIELAGGEVYLPRGFRE